MNYSNELLAMLAEGASAEARIYEEYCNKITVNEGVGDFIKDKASAIGDQLKKIYDKVMSIIDELVLKVLNYKDKTELHFIRKALQETAWKDTKNDIMISGVKHVKVGELTTQINKLTTAYDGIDFNNIDSVKSLFESLQVKDVVVKSNSEIIKSPAEIKKKIENGLVKDKNSKKFKITDEDYKFVYSFITSDVETMRDNLRRLQKSIKRSYVKVIADVKEGLKSEVEDRVSRNSQINTKVREIKSNFEILMSVILGYLGMITEGIRYSKAVVGAVKKAKEKTGGDDDNSSTKQTVDHKSAVLGDNNIDYTLDSIFGF